MGEAVVFVWLCGALVSLPAFAVAWAMEDEEYDEDMLLRGFLPIVLAVIWPLVAVTAVGVGAVVAVAAFGRWGARRITALRHTPPGATGEDQDG